MIRATTRPRSHLCEREFPGMRRREGRRVGLMGGAWRLWPSAAVVDLLS
jgi:hypothetical protein